MREEQEGEGWAWRAGGRDHVTPVHYAAPLTIHFQTIPARLYLSSAVEQFVKIRLNSLP